MPFATAIAIFVLIWWLVLFAVLPWGVRSQHESGDIVQGTDPGAPTRFRVVQKLLWTTLIASGIYGLGYVAYVERLVTIDRLMSPFVKNSSCYQKFSDKC
jgi:predicted secreted protein